MKLVHLALASACCALLLGVSGCASVDGPKGAPGDLRPEQSLRKSNVIRAFESKRDEAQIHAALNRWREGDLDNCRQTLEMLLERNPQHHEARLLLAELLLYAQQIDAAFEHAEQALRQDPKDARAQHTMGLVLDAKGDAAATSCFQRAAEIEPANELYQASYRMAQATAGPAPGDDNSANAVASDVR